MRKQLQTNAIVSYRVWRGITRTEVRADLETQYTGTYQHCYLQPGECRLILDRLHLDGYCRWRVAGLLVVSMIQWWQAKMADRALRPQVRDDQETMASKISARIEPKPPQIVKSSGNGGCWPLLANVYIHNQ